MNRNKNDQIQMVNNGEETRMRIFGDIVRKIIWIVIALLLIGGGFVAILKLFFSNPNQTTTSTLANPNNKPISTSNPTNSNSNNNSQNTTALSSYISALAQAEEVELIRSNKLEKGAVLRLYDSPNLGRATTTKVMNISEMRFLGVEQCQSLEAFFEAPENSQYIFNLVGFNRYENHYRSKADQELLIRINGHTLENSAKGQLFLNKGWHSVQVQYRDYQCDDVASTFNLKELALKWRKPEEKSFKSLTTWRSSL